MSRFRPMVSRRTPSGTHFAELFLAPGPHSIGETGDNSYQALFGRNWLLVWDRDTGFLQLYQESAGAWLEVVEDLPPVFGSPAPAGSRRWSLAFDQAARVILAYEDAEGVVRVTRWDPSANQYVQNVTFAGVDPCVVMDASWSLSVPGSDVLLFYLSPDRTRVLCRVQRDLYAVEHELWTFEEPVILDRVVAAPIRYQVLVSDSAGTPLPEVLVSALYPLRAAESAASRVVALPGEYVREVVRRAQAELSSISAVALDGVYASPIINYSQAGLDLGASAVAIDGVYEPSVIFLNQSIGLEAEALALPGEYVLAVKRYGQPTDQQSVTAVALNGEYTQ